MSWLDRLRARLFGYDNIEPEGIMPTVNRVPTTTENPQTTSVAPQTDEKINAPKSPERVLFVCSGNICRSAYGAVKFEQLLKDRNLSMRIASAGTLRLVGRSAAPEMIETAQERGLDLTQHRSSALSKPLIDAADVIFAMEHGHKLEIMRICPDSEQRIVLLGQCLPEPKLEILDPMGHTPEIYREVATEIDIALENWLHSINLTQSEDA